MEESKSVNDGHALALARFTCLVAPVNLQVCRLVFLLVLPRFHSTPNSHLTQAAGMPNSHLPQAAGQLCVRPLMSLPPLANCSSIASAVFDCLHVLRQGKRKQQGPQS